MASNHSVLKKESIPDTYESAQRMRQENQARLLEMTWNGAKKAYMYSLTIPIVGDLVETATIVVGIGAFALLISPIAITAVNMGVQF